MQICSFAFRNKPLKQGLLLIKIKNLRLTMWKHLHRRLKRIILVLIYILSIKKCNAFEVQLFRRAFYYLIIYRCGGANSSSRAPAASTRLQNYRNDCSFYLHHSWHIDFLIDSSVQSSLTRCVIHKQDRCELTCLCKKSLLHCAYSFAGNCLILTLKM